MVRALTLGLTCIICFGAASEVRADASAYSNPDGKFSFRVPDGWIEIPPKALDGLLKVMPRAATQNIQCVVGYQLKDRHAFQAPLILVQIHLGSPGPQDAAMRQLKTNQTPQFRALEQRLQKIDPTARVTPGEMQIDRERHIIFWNIDMASTATGDMRNLMAICLGREGSAQFDFAVSDAEYQQYLPAFHSLIDTFTFEPEYWYDESAFAPAADWGRYVVMGVLIVGAGITIQVGRKIVRRKMPRRDPEFDEYT